MKQVVVLGVVFSALCALPGCSFLLDVEVVNTCTQSVQVDILGTADAGMVGFIAPGATKTLSEIEEGAQTMEVFDAQTGAKLNTVDFELSDDGQRVNTCN